MPIPRDSKGHFVKGYINPNKGAKNLKISGKNHPMFGKHHKEESKLKMSLAKKGKKPKFIPDNKGRKISKEQIEFLRKINTGKKISEETKKKISESKKKNPTRYWLGKKRPEITGEKNPKWKGGYSRKLYNNSNWFIRRANADGQHTKEEWEILKAQCNWTCLRCKKREPEIILTQDHIIPLSKGGSNNIENIQPLCKKCNSWKHNKTIKY